MTTPHCCQSHTSMKATTSCTIRMAIEPYVVSLGTTRLNSELSRVASVAARCRCYALWRARCGAHYDRPFWTWLGEHVRRGQYVSGRGTGQFPLLAECTSSAEPLLLPWSPACSDRRDRHRHTLVRAGTARLNDSGSESFARAMKPARLQVAYLPIDASWPGRMVRRTGLST